MRRISLATLLLVAGCGTSGSPGGTGIVGTTDDMNTTDIDGGVINGKGDGGAGNPGGDGGVVIGNGDGSVVVGGGDGSTGGAADFGQGFKADMIQINTGKLIRLNSDIVGVTSDDFVIGYDKAAKSAFAFPLGGGMDLTVDPGPDNVSISGKVVFTWANTDSNTGVGDLSVWTAAGGEKSLVVGTAPSGLVAASDDGAYIAYMSNASADGSTADLYVAKVDGTAAKKVYTGIQTAIVSMDPSCQPVLRFIAGPKLLLTYCEPDGATTALPIVATVDPTTGTATTLLRDAQAFIDVSKAGDKVFVIADAGDGWVMPAGGGKGIFVDSDVAYGFILGDGSAVVFHSSTGVMKRGVLPAFPTNPPPTPDMAMPHTPDLGTMMAAADGGMMMASGDGSVIRDMAVAHDLSTGPDMTTPPVSATLTTLVASGANTFDGVSDDFNWVIYTNMDDGMMYSDLYLASTSVPGTPTTLLKATSGGIFGNAFTSDSSRALYYTDGLPEYIGTLTSLAVTAGATPTVHGTRSWSELAAKGTSMVYNTNWRAGSVNGRADLWVTDSAKAGAPVLIAGQADVDFSLSHAKDKVIFALDQKLMATDGIYYADLP